VKHLSKTTFDIKVTSIHPAYDNQGNEYICVEFGFRSFQMPMMIPTNVPKEVSEMIEASRDVVKVIVPPQLQAQWRTYANRLTLFLTMEEWESLQQKYTVSDEFNVIIKKDGSIIVNRV